MKLLLTLASALTLTLSARSYAGDALKPVAGVYIVVFLKGVPDIDGNRLKGTLESNARKAGLKVIGSGTIDEYDAWFNKELKAAQSDKRMSLINAIRELDKTSRVFVRCVALNDTDGDNAYWTGVHADRIGFVEAPDGDFVLTAGNEKFRAMFADVRAFHSDGTVGITDNADEIAKTIVTEFGEFLTAWQKAQEK